MSKKEWKSVISFLVLAGMLAVISGLECFDKALYIVGRVSFIVTLTMVIRVLVLAKLED